MSILYRDKVRTLTMCRSPGTFSLSCYQGAAGWADLRSSRPRAALTAVRNCQQHLEGGTAQLPDHSDARSTAQHLTRLTSEIISEVAEHQSGRHAVAGHGDMYPGTRPGS